MGDCIDVNYVYFKDDGTVLGLSTSGGTSFDIDQICCESLGYTYTNGSCLWNTDTESDYIKVTLNPSGNDGVVFSGGDIESCYLDIQFDYLLEFNSNDILSINPLTVFNDIDISVSIDRVDLKDNISNVIFENPYTLTTVYSEEVIKITDLKDYLSGNTSTGLRVIGDETTYVINNIITAIGTSSVVSGDSFNSCWLTHSFSVTNSTVLDSIIDEKIKLSIVINSVNSDFSVLLDNIKINKTCEVVDRVDKKIIKCPGFELDRVVDNRKSWLKTNTTDTREYSLKQRETFYRSSDSALVINSKEIDLQIDPALAIEQSVFTYTKANKDCLISEDESGIFDLLTTQLETIDTTEEFLRVIKSELIDVTDRRILTGYPKLRVLYDYYIKLSNCGVSQKFNYGDLIKYSKQLNKNWIDIIEQLIPATTIWGSANIYRNTIFDDNKFKYKSYSLINCDSSSYGTSAIGSVNTDIEVLYTDISPSGLTNPTYKCNSLYITDIGSDPEYRGVNTSVAPDTDIEFILRIDTTKGTGDSFTLPLLYGGGYVYDFTVDYGDGGGYVPVNTYGDANSTHTYSSGGTYDVSIKGKVGAWSFNNGGDKLKAVEVIQWGNCEFNYINGMFYGCTNLTAIPTTGGIYAPNTLECQDIFKECSLTEINSTLFNYCTKNTSFIGVFDGNNLVNIPNNLFDKNILNIRFDSAFNGNKLVSIPDNLFDKNILSSHFNSVFRNNYITEIPVDLFKYNTELLFLEFTFYNNNISSIPPNLFDTIPLLKTAQSCFSRNRLIDIPDNLFDLCIELYSVRGIFNTNNITIIPDNLFINNVNIYDFGYAFRDNKLASIPNNLFYTCRLVSDFSYTFGGNNISTIPDDIFINCIDATTIDFSYTFYGNNISVIPDDIFRYNVNAISFSNTFYSNDLTTIPLDIFRYNLMVTSFNGTFKNNDLISIPNNIFYYNELVTNYGEVFSYNLVQCTLPITIFNIINLNKVTNWYRSFYCTSSIYSYNGTVQDIWNYSDPTTNKNECFFNCVNLSNYSDIPNEWKGL